MESFKFWLLCVIDALLVLLFVGITVPRCWRLDLLLGELGWIKRTEPVTWFRIYAGGPMEGHGWVLTFDAPGGALRAHFWGIPWWHGIPYGRRRFGLSTWIPT